MKPVKNPAAKLTTLALSTVAFGALWGWIASRQPEAGEAEGFAATTAAPVVRRIFVVRVQNPDGSVTERVVSESEFQQTQAQVAAPEPITRSSGS
jgi:hypothetical protein